MNSERDVVAFAQFFDDIRHEVGGKMSFMGQYTGQLIIPDPGFPIDRLSIVFHAHWPRGYWPAKTQISVELSGENIIDHEMALPPPPEDQVRPDPPFDRHNFQAVVFFRGRPCVPGDTIHAWLIVDGRRIPAGRLAISAAPILVANPSIAGQQA